MPMVKMFGDDQKAFILTATLWSVIALALLIFCFVKCEEKVVIAAREQKKEKRSGKATLKALLTNQYFWAVAVLWMLQNSASGVIGIVLPYYSKYIMHNDTWVYSVLYFAELFTMVVVVIICPVFMKKYGKRNIVLAGAIVAIFGQLLFMMNPYSFPVALASCIIRGIGAGPLNACVFGMMGDVVEFGQWKSKLRQESYIFAAGSVGSKIAPGITSALVTGLLTSSGYISSVGGGAVQPQEALNAIVAILKFGPLIVWVLVLIVAFLYKLDKKYPKIMAELAEREARGEM